MTSEAQDELELREDSSPQPGLPSDPKAYEVHDPPVTIGEWIWRPWTRFSIRAILLATLLACILLAVLRPRHEPESPPRVKIIKHHNRGNDMMYCQFTITFPDGSRETYLDLEPYGSLDEVVFVVDGQYFNFRRERPDGPGVWQPKRKLTPEMYETFQQLSETVAAKVNVKALRYGRRVRIELPRDFPRIQDLLKEKRASQEAASSRP